MIDVVWPTTKPLDHFMLIDIFDEVDWSPVGKLEYNIIEDLAEAKGDGVVLVVNGTNTRVKKLNEDIARFKWALLIVVSDENNLFKIDKVSHPNIKMWVQTPRVGKQYNNVRYFGVGYGYAAVYRDENLNRYLNKESDLFISAQNTHPRRNLVFEELKKYRDDNPELRVNIFETEGFTQGMTPENYYHYMADAKIAPAPSGIVSPDSFRLYEALEFGAIPIADDISPAEGYDSKGYWRMVFPDAPFPILQDDDVASQIYEAQENYQQKANSIFAWWIGQKRRYAYELVDDIRALSNTPATAGTLKDKVTIIVPVSPWRSHPNTKVLDITLQSIRFQFPQSEIIVTFDGVRDEQIHKFDNYQEFIKRMLVKINAQYKNVLPLVFTEHAHQTGMMREALKHVRTESVLYVEGDSPLFSDREIDWDEITGLIHRGDANIIRLYNKDKIPEEHDYLMYHQHDLENNGDKYIATSQWSQQPHLVRTDTYRYIMNEYFTEDSVCFIEDKFYYHIVGECIDSWNKWRMFIYIPEDKLPRSYHLDGRDGEEKYDKNQIW